MDSVNQFDFAFIIDTTGSMNHLIDAARKKMVAMIEGLSVESDIDMRFGVVEYRDHPPQDKMIFRAYDLTSDLNKARSVIDGLKANGGGDAPEAVFAGIVAAITELNWRPHSQRIAILVGDAPPHGVGVPGDGFRDGCPSGETMDSVSARSEENRLTLYSIGLNNSCEPYFENISRLTGGRYFRLADAEGAMNKIRDVLAVEFGDIEFDCIVRDAWTLAASPTVDEIAEQLGAAPSRVGASVCRLQSRGLLLSDHVSGS